MSLSLATIARRPRRILSRVKRDQNGVIMIEMAFALPIFTAFAFVGIEIANLAITNMRISQVAMTVADNLSRAKQTVPLGLPQLREVDINDALLGTEVQGGKSIEILKQGRIVVSSLQQDASGKQTILWQRCKGKLNVASAYGAQGATQPSSGTGGFQGMGVGTQRVQAEANSAIIFSEVTYDYKPMFGDWVLGKIRLRREAAFYVRDDRDLTKVYNPAPTDIPSTCNKFDTF